MTHLEGATRGLAAEFLVTLGEARDKVRGGVVVYVGEGGVLGCLLLHGAMLPAPAQ